MIFDKYPNYKKMNDRHFWAVGYYVDTIGRNEEIIKKYVKDKLEKYYVISVIKK